MRRPLLVLILALLLTTAGPARAAPVVLAPPAAAGGDPHAQLRRILDRPLFQAWRLRQERPDDPSTDWGDARGLSKYFDWVGDFFDWLFRSPPQTTPLPRNSAGGGLPTLLKTGAWIVLGVAVLLAVVLVVLGLRRPAATTATARVLSRRQIRDALESGDALALDAADWMDEAGRLAAEEDFRAVYRALYLALLSGLHTLGKIEHSPNRTNGTYVRRYRGPADERQTFGELTDVFDRVWYGRRPGPGDDLDRLRRQVAALTRDPGVA